MAFLIPSIIVKGLYSGFVSAVGAIAIGTCKLAKSIYMHQNPDVTKIVKKLDIERRLQLVNSIINIINTTSSFDEAKVKLNDLEKTQIFELVGAEVDLKNDPIELCMRSLHEVIQDINDCLITISNKIARHNCKWFKHLRTLNLRPLLEDLELNSELLDRRYNDLLSVSMFLGNRKNN